MQKTFFYVIAALCGLLIFQFRWTQIGNEEATVPRRSSLWCLDYNSPNRTRCYFQNVCVDGQNGSLLYYVTPNSKSPDLNFAKSVSLHIIKSQPLSITLLHSEPPKLAKWWPGVVVYFSSYWPVNFAHSLDDDFFALWRLMRRFGFLKWGDRKRNFFLTADNKIDNDHAAHGRGKQEDQTFGHHLRELGVLFGAGISSNRKAPSNLNSGSKENPLVCSRHLLVGTGGLRMFNDPAGTHDEFVNEILGLFGIDPFGPLPSQPRIGIYRKNGRRRILNDEEIAEVSRTHEKEGLGCSSPINFPQALLICPLFFFNRELE